MEADATTRLMEVINMALDGNSETPAKNNAEQEAAHRTTGTNKLFNTFIVVADKGGGDGGSEAKANAG